MLKSSLFVKIRVSVPVSHADDVRQALGDAGAGTQGTYTYCSGSYRQIGRFTPGLGATPAIGEVGIPEEVEEDVIETLCHKDIVCNVIKAILAVHPYEEPAIDVIERLDF